ncbi:hypothetical protein [Anaerovorax sp. IOR16]|uniref:hypothetical protein n=1 Tax=Anaerovorax sp. IOR16 TaxID=2773458 RepID=UPI0019CF60B9|nr:hypothetical protein [Anaerovorax sp. IOR16]
MDNDIIYMYICPKCGSFGIGFTKNKCDRCNTDVINTNINWDNYLNLSDEDQDKIESELYEKYVFNNPLYSETAFNRRIQLEAEEDAEYDREEEERKHIPHCPICGSANVHKISLGNKVGAAAIFNVFSIGHISKTFKCKNCGAKF